jgi:hypothetical protein
VTKLQGNIRITRSPESEKSRPHFDVSFVPYHGRMNAQVVRVPNQDELVEFLMRLKISEDDSARWAGKAASEGVVLIPNIQLTDIQLKDSQLVA